MAIRNLPIELPTERQPSLQSRQIMDIVTGHACMSTCTIFICIRDSGKRKVFIKAGTIFQPRGNFNIAVFIARGSARRFCNQTETDRGVIPMPHARTRTLYSI